MNRRWKNGAGELQESPVFVEIVAWGKQAETVATYLTKGRPVVVEGRLQLDQWETEAGEHRSRLKVVANRVTFLGRGARAGSLVWSAAVRLCRWSWSPSTARLLGILLSQLGCPYERR